MVFSCIKLDQILLSSYNILQDLFHYNDKRNFQDALDFISYIVDRLNSTNHPELISVASSFHRWRFAIANAFSRSQNGTRITNAIAENINNHLKSIIKVSYGYHNFDRFRKRAMLILTYKKAV